MDQPSGAPAYLRTIVESLRTDPAYAAGRTQARREIDSRVAMNRAGDMAGLNAALQRDTDVLTLNRMLGDGHADCPGCDTCSTRRRRAADRLRVDVLRWLAVLESHPDAAGWIADNVLGDRDPQVLALLARETRARPN